ncbi:LysR family transcriptional regulator [Rhizobium leguminosarum]|uniref:LysR family transcriptional regulator n=1 Tax=Rhizobium leguminosarum TaxID=384 RepID=UPI003F950B79
MRSLISQLSIHKLEVYCAVVELGSVSRAAARLNVAQPVVSAHLKSLSEKLGVALTVRQGRNVGLTESGELVYSWARELVSRTRELERQVGAGQDGAGGKAVIGASMTIGSYVLPGLVVRFLRQNPEGEASIRVGPPQLVLEAVRSGDSDFAYTILHPGEATGGCDVSLIREEELLLIAAATDSAVPDAVNPKTAFFDLPFLSAENGSPRREIEEHLLDQAGIRRGRVFLELGHAEALKKAVLAGGGVALLFRSSVQEELASGSLRSVGLGEISLKAPVYCIRRRGKILTPYQQKLQQELSTLIASTN